MYPGSSPNIAKSQNIPCDLKSHTDSGGREISASSSTVFSRIIKTKAGEGKPLCMADNPVSDTCHSTSSSASGIEQQRKHLYAYQIITSENQENKTEVLQSTSTVDSMPDRNLFKILYNNLSRYKERLSFSEHDPLIQSKISCCEVITECLQSYEKNNVPAAYPDFSCFTEEELKTGEVFEITSLFIHISRLRSCAALDKVFLDKLSNFLGNSQSIEVYAGNGWLTNELKKRSVNIEASDNFELFEVDNFPDNFIRDVSRLDAKEAAKRFIADLPEDEKGYIVISFPAGVYGQLIGVFEHACHHPGCSIIAIGLDENNWCFESWWLPNSLTRKDITDHLKYTPTPLKERVILYSFSSSKT